jgi:hypothetical protein
VNDANIFVTKHYWRFCVFHLHILEPSLPCYVGTPERRQIFGAGLEKFVSVKQIIVPYISIRS